jgi:hypothetical protein
MLGNRWWAGVVTLGSAAVALAGPSLSGAAAPSSHGGAVEAHSDRATLSTFAGTWTGHTRILRISRSGDALEHLDNGCCDHVMDLRFDLSHVRGTRTNASATAKVTKVRVLDPSAFVAGYQPPHVGEVHTLRLRHGVITEPFTTVTYCNFAAGASGKCGA